VSNPDLVEISKRNADFSKHYGKFWGGLIHLSHVNAATGRRPLLWSGLAAAAGVLLRFGHLPWQ
jgi:hypothetical protein